jgi:uncharacterized protein
MSDPAAERVVPCPTCRGPSVYGSRNAFRPFCCERCRDVDLGAWASEKFRVAEAQPPHEDDRGAAPDLH